MLVFSEIFLIIVVPIPTKELLPIVISGWIVVPDPIRHDPPILQSPPIVEEGMIDV